MIMSLDLSNPPMNTKREMKHKENCGGKVCGWVGDECTCNLGYEEKESREKVKEVIEKK